MMELTAEDDESSSAVERLSLERRKVLATMGAIVVTPVAAVRNASAASDGYGATAYGDGTYGDSTSSGDNEPTAAPQIGRIDASDTSNPKNPHAEVVVDWTASITEGELDSATLTVTDSTGVVRSWTYELSGQSVAHSESHRIKHGGGTTYTVDLTVDSAHGTSQSARTTFSAP